MKTKLKILALIFCICTSLKLESKIRVSLQNAFDKKYIKAKAICKGGLQLDYSVSNLIKDSLIIIIPAILVYGTFEDECTKESLDSEMNKCYESKAIKENKISICNKIKDITLVHKCITYLALSKNNLEKSN